MAVLPLFLLAACSGSPGGSRGNIAVAVELADMEKPMPLISETSLDNELQSIMYLSILSAKWEDGRLHYLTADESPTALARSYEYFGPDSASIRYHLRTDAVWSDGTPVTAHDAVWTIETQGDPRTASPRRDYNRQIREVLAENDSTLVIHFHRRYPEMLFHSAGAVVPSHIYRDSEPDRLRSHPALLDPASNLVVSGPFRITEWRRGERVVLEPNPLFTPEPHLDRLVFRVIPEQTTRMIELQTGNIDLVQVPFEMLEPIDRLDHVRIETREKRFYDYIAYNPRAHEFFADPDIRRALGLAIDLEDLIRALQMEEHAIPAGGPYAPIFRDLYDPEAHAALPYDPDEALRILREKGWEPGPDRILQKNGVPFRFTLATNAGNQRRADVAEIVQQQWRRIGVDAEIRIVESNTFFEQLNRREFDAAIAGWGVGLSPDLQQIWGDPDLPFNFVSYDNPEVRRLIREALAQPTEELATPLWSEAASKIIADQPYTWLFYLDGLIGVNNRLQGTLINTLGTYQEIWNWRIAE